ncbi:uncharacterized protein BHQ10_004058 [Talaromyces amestolkiae]|uniref:RED-like N-terminal domain-containing protein n=1 Tax=Talaromyces amestolkiae TaxID=1196081 RepID=A0A364KWV8_TALAM|nr:uncharacterized protein BHQ10_004058 [Talaromyces amestolkiae]RAO68046.1 hypothetical protein BHQ10_004058 [Talaromyces amestolkiae]
MNNEQFRRLVLDQPGKRSNNNNSNTVDKNAQTPSSSQTPSSLGSRMRSSIPMTPRHVRGGTSNTNEFARQLAEQSQPPAKRFKASAAPKGTRFASGYQDRTALRRQEQDDETAEEKKEGIEQRLKALEEMVKLGQIDQATFDNLRKEIGVGGDLKSTHLVKGLDWDLLRRAKAGEDLSQKTEEEADEKEEEGIDPGDVDDELDRVLDEKEDGFVAPAPKEKKVKKGNLAVPPPPSGKLSRDEILKQLKASRAAAAAPAAPPESTLSTKFKKIDKSDKKRWIETDPITGRRKEILVITDAEGNTKRKTRWLDKEPPPHKQADIIPKVDNNGLLLPGQDAKPLGMEVPAVIAARIAAEKAAAEEAEDDDIFAGVGTDYNPLGDLDEDDEEDSDDEKEEREEAADVKDEKVIKTAATTEPSTQHQPRRNYFKKTDEDTAEEEPRTNPLTSDPTLMAAFKRAAALRQASTTRAEGDEDDDHAVDMEEGEFADDVDPERLARRKKFLEEARRRDALDAQDLDFGFGSSRIEDEEDEEGPTFGDSEKQRGSNKRKRGPKKRKGDKDSATDVLRVMEGRKKS